MKSIGIITRDHRMPFQKDIILGIHEALSGDYQIHVDSLHKDRHNPHPIRLDIDALDGVLVIANILSHDELKSLHQHDVPVTLVSHHDPDLPIPAVIQNDEDGIAQIMDYLIDQKNRRQIVLIQGDLTRHNGIRRTELFHRSLKQHNLDIVDEYCLKGNFDPVTAANSMIEFLESEKPFDAIVAADYLMGCAVLDVLHLFEVDIPQTVSVIAFGDGPESRDMGLSVAGVDVVEIGRQAAQQLILQLAGVQIDSVTRLKPQLSVRDSS